MQDHLTAADERSIAESLALRDRAMELIPRGAQTNSKSPSQFVQGVAPTHIERGEGSHVWDVDGNEYIDYAMARGPVVLGHQYSEVTMAAVEQLADGVTYSMPHPLQVEVAEAVRDAVPCAEMVKFGKNGNDVTALAAKLARAYTGRDVIATCGYHGWPDVWTSVSSSDRGIPDGVADYTATFDYNDLESLERVFEEHEDDVAGIVINPVDVEAPRDGFLEAVREVADREGAVLVFDEIVTGFRFALGGAGEFFGVEPDLACFAKAVANGFPLSALAGHREVMEVLADDDFVYSMTYGGEALSLAAAEKCLEILVEEDVHDHLFRVGDRLKEGYNEIAEEYGIDHRTECVGYAPRSSIRFHGGEGEADNLAKSLFMQECHKRGVLFAAIHLPSYSHTDADVEHTLAVYREAMETVAEGISEGTVERKLEGDPIGTTVLDRTTD